MAPDLRKLKARANQAYEKGKHKKAAELFLELSRAEPGDPGWSHRAGELFRKVGRRADAVACLAHAADAYGRQGFHLKGVAVCKVILSIEPDHEETQARLEGLLAKLAKPGTARPSPAAAAPRPPSAAAPVTASTEGEASGAAAPAGAGEAPGAAAPSAAPATAGEAPGAAASLGREPRPSAAPAVAAAAQDGVDLPRGSEPLAIELSPEEPLSALSLGQVMPGAHRTQEMPALQVFEIPLEDEDLEMAISGVLDDGPRAPEAPAVAPAAWASAASLAEALQMAEPTVQLPGVAGGSAGGAGSPSATTGPAPVARGAGVALGGDVAAVGVDEPGGDELEVELEISPGGDRAAADAAAVGGDELEVALETVPVDDEVALEVGDAPAGAVGASPAASPAAAPSELPTIPLFSSLSRDELQRLVHRAEVVEVGAGELVFAEGETGDALYVVVQGAVRVVSGTGSAQVELGRLAEGAFFGEIALISDSPRTASVVADGDGTLIKISREVIAELLGEYPEVLRGLLCFFRDRLVNSLLVSAPLFAPFSPEERRNLAGLFRFIEVEAGTAVISEGELAAGLLIVLSGTFDVSFTKDGVRTPLATLGAGDMCGEMSLLGHAPAMATIRAASKCWALFLSRQQFHEVIVTHPQVLAYIGELIEERRRQNRAVLEGTGAYAEGHVPVY